jgi:fatty acyl-CoA reductase
LPVAIARPSIVTATWQEPVPGWVDSINGPGGASLLGSLGIARTMVFKPKNKADLIPVDIVSNSLISIAWRTAMDGRTEKLKIYNITSGDSNPISWQQYLEFGREAAIETPSIRVVRPLATVMRGDGVSKFNDVMTKWVSEILFAYFVDFIMILLGQKTIMVRLVRRMHHAFDLLGYFARREWSFPSNNLFALYDSMSDVDRQMFKLDIRQVNWRAYIHDSYMGIRRYLLKEDDANIEKARKRMKMISIGYYALQVLITLMVVLVLFMSPLSSLIRFPIENTFNAVSWTANRLCSNYVIGVK